MWQRHTPHTLVHTPVTQVNVPCYAPANPHAQVHGGHWLVTPILHAPATPLQPQHTPHLFEASSMLAHLYVANTINRSLHACRCSFLLVAAAYLLLLLLLLLLLSPTQHAGLPTARATPSSSSSSRGQPIHAAAAAAAALVNARHAAAWRPGLTPWVPAGRLPARHPCKQTAASNQPMPPAKQAPVNCAPAMCTGTGHWDALLSACALAVLLQSVGLLAAMYVTHACAPSTQRFSPAHPACTPCNCLQAASCPAP